MNAPARQAIIQNKIYTIVGKPGKGKTFFATFLASHHKRIYANFSIKRFGKEVANQIKSIDDLDNIPFSTVKWIVVIDEGGVNVNARRSSSESNMEFGKLAMLGRKKDVNIIIISQLERMADVYYRELASFGFEMNSWFETSTKLMFEYTVSCNGQILGSKFVDLFEWAQKSWYEYDTLESGKIDLNTKKEPLAI